MQINCFETVFQSDIEQSPREREKEKNTHDRREKKNIKTTPPAPTASTIGCKNFISLFIINKKRGQR